MNLSEYDFPEIDDTNLGLPELNTDMKLVEEANNRDLDKGYDKFNELFFKGGEVILQEDVKGTWKEDAWIYAKVLMRSYTVEQSHKEAICAMIFEEVLEL